MMTFLIRLKIILIFSLCSTNALFAQYQMEKLDRGLVAVRTNTNSVFLSWRWLGTENNVQFNVYKNGIKLNATPIEVSNYTDNAATGNPSYYIKVVENGIETGQSKSITPWAQLYYKLPLKVPAAGTSKSGENYTYSPNDCSVGDVDGDGEYEIFVKWDPSNSKDNSQSGYTGNVYLDCYKMNGTFLWRIDLGINIRAGAHYTQFLVYDFDGDGKAEMACKTADGTKDGVGTIIGNANADYRNSSGYILTGPEYLTVFNGQTGAAVSTVNYLPGRGTVSSWGDGYGNRVDRFIAAVAYLDGKTPSMVFGRGYYTRLVRAAWDFKNGKLVQRWIFDSNTSGNGAYAGQGNHQLSVADVDGDGAQEVINGASVIDNTGQGLYSNGHGHGDALHVSDLDPDRPGLEVWQCQEEPSKYGNYGLDFRDAKTGQSLWGLGGGNQGDVGRAMAADIDPRYKGYECWGSVGPLFTCKGTNIGTNRPSINFGLYWDGDLLRELLDGAKIDKWNYLTASSNRIATLYNNEYGNGSSNNTTKANPCLSGDIMGDWREEVILRSPDNNFLLIYTTTVPSNYKLRTLMHDPQYRVAIAWQNSGYNQPPHPGYYLGDGMTMPNKPNITIVGSSTNQAPTINWNNTGSNNYCLGSVINLSVSANDTDGSITSVQFYNGTTLLFTDNIAPYTYAWTPNTIGTYNITAKATDNLGSSASSLTYNLNVNSPIAVISSNNGTIIPYKGSLLLTASNGTGYTYQWKNANTNISGATNNTYTANKAGSYSVTITANGCSTNSNALVLTEEPAPKKYVYIYDNSGNYSWQNINNWTPKAIPRTIDTIIVRTGELQINGINHTAPVYVETFGILRLVTSNSDLSDLILQGGTLKVFTSAPELILTANIKVEQTSTLLAGSLASTLFTINGSIIGSNNLIKTGIGTTRLIGNNGNYKGTWEIKEGKLQVRAANAIGLCGVRLYAPARLDIETASTFYALKADVGSGVDLDNTLNVTHVVFGNDNINAGTYNNSTLPNYIGGISTLTVNNNIINYSGATNFCKGNNLVFNAANTGNPQWKNNGVNLSTLVNYTATTSGNYTVEIKNINTCAIESAPVTITVYDLPTASITNNGVNTICEGNNTQLLANTNVEYTYQWNNGNTAITGATTSNLTVNKTGTYNVKIRNTNNCVATSNNISITVNPAIAVSINPTGTVYAPILLTANSQTNNINYTWYKDNNIINGNSATFNASSPGNYFVKITNGICNAQSNVVTVIQNQAPSVSLNTNYIPANNGNSGAIQISVSVNDPDNSVAIVEVYDGTQLLTTLNQGPYTYQYNNPSIGLHEISVRVNDGSGNIVTKTNIVSVNNTTTGINQQQHLQILYYPNPYNDVITIEINGQANYTIKDLLGKEVEKGYLNYKGNIGNNLPIGHYLLIINNQEVHSVYKIEKQ